MSPTPDAAREYWRGVLDAGGLTAVPRWTRDPVPGVAEHQAPVPTVQVSALRELADELGVPLGTVLLAAHARVLAALSGEGEVVTGGGFSRFRRAAETDPRDGDALRSATHPSRVEAHSAPSRLTLG